MESFFQLRPTQHSSSIFTLAAPALSPAGYQGIGGTSSPLKRVYQRLQFPVDEYYLQLNSRAFRSFNG